MGIEYKMCNKIVRDTKGNHAFFFNLSLDNKSDYINEVFTNKKKGLTASR